MLQKPDGVLKDILNYFNSEDPFEIDILIGSFEQSFKSGCNSSDKLLMNVLFTFKITFRSPLEFNV